MTSQPIKLRILTEKEQKLLHQLFIGKVADRLGFDKTMELLVESKKAVLKK